jgi:hypothetical protein
MFAAAGSAAASQVPILVAFDVEVPAPGAAPGVGPEVPAKMACIFKVGDDIRQDVLAIQVCHTVHGFLPLVINYYDVVHAGLAGCCVLVAVAVTHSHTLLVNMHIVCCDASTVFV